MELHDNTEELHATIARLAEAQRVGCMGSYDWDIASDTNVWSDELYRIYGTEPQSFNASYERFMSFIHPDDRAKVQAVHAEAFATCQPYQTEERIVRPDGDVRVLATTGEVATDAEGRPARIYGICRDITEQRRAEEAASLHLLRLHDSELRQRHALEINDNVVQGLSAALYAFESGLTGPAVEALRKTISSARLMMNSLLAGSGGAALGPGDLVRKRPAASALPEAWLEHQEEVEAPCETTHRVLLVDDARDIRLLVRRLLAHRSGFEVVGEARDGREAIRIAGKLRPDIILLDLAMPVMDGLEALPALRAYVPSAKIVVLSGFDEGRVRQAAMDAGADAFVEKGGYLSDLVATLEDVLRPSVATSA